MNQQDIEQGVKAVLLKMKDSSQPDSAVHEMGVFASLDDAVAAAKVAQQGLKSVAMRQLAIHAIREAGERGPGARHAGRRMSLPAGADRR